MGVPPAKLHEKPAEANKLARERELKAGFFDPVSSPFRRLGHLRAAGGRHLSGKANFTAQNPSDRRPIGSMKIFDRAGSFQLVLLHRFKTLLLYRDWRLTIYICTPFEPRHSNLKPGIPGRRKK
jgi:hypothetical protein